MEDLAGFVIQDNYWSSYRETYNPISYQRKCKWYGKRKGMMYYDVVIGSTRYHRLRVYKDKKGETSVEYAKTREDCPDERTTPLNLRVKPDRINLKYQEIEKEAVRRTI